MAIVMQQDLEPGWSNRRAVREADPTPAPQKAPEPPAEPTPAAPEPPATLPTKPARVRKPNAAKTKA